MLNMLSIDPGLRECGVAEWKQGKLVSASLVVAPKYEKGAEQWASMSCEVAEFYPVDEYGKVCIEKMECRKELPSAWANLIQLAHVSGGIYSLYSNALLQDVSPARWTGGRPKPKNHKRIWRCLKEEEEEVLVAALERCPAKNHKEVLDAVGIGLFVLKRL